LLRGCEEELGANKKQGDREVTLFSLSTKSAIPADFVAFVSRKWYKRKAKSQENQGV
jgi:hypothetical protein